MIDLACSVCQNRTHTHFQMSRVPGEQFVFFEIETSRFSVSSELFWPLLRQGDQPTLGAIDAFYPHLEQCPLEELHQFCVPFNSVSVPSAVPFT